jgi:preprotein translocase SecE subunit
MPRDRQRAKQRQAERRAERLERRREGVGARGSDGTPAAPTSPSPDLAEEALLRSGAPPEDVGRSDTVVEHPPPAPDTRADSALGARADVPGASVEATAPAAARREHGRVVGFLVAVWAELQRVEWPDRRTLTTLTWVVLGFVLIAGGYLGLLDAIFSRLIQALL